MDGVKSSDLQKLLDVMKKYCSQIEQQLKSPPAREVCPSVEYPPTATGIPPAPQLLLSGAVLSPPVVNDAPGYASLESFPGRITGLPSLGDLLGTTSTGGASSSPVEYSQSYPFASPTFHWS